MLLSYVTMFSTQNSFLAIYSYTNQQSISSECQILNILGLASQEIEEIVSSAVQTTLLMDILIVIFIVHI